MAQPTFFKQPPSSTLAEIAALTKALLVDGSSAGKPITGLASLDEAGPTHLTFFDNLRYAGQLAQTRAGACLVNERFEASVPSHVAVLRTKAPFAAFVALGRELHQDALRPQSGFDLTGIADPRSFIPPRIWKTV
jgi:UDP-3-O-[3-hydroxymyristoyl] glucosamine N-acyltransferase